MPTAVDDGADGSPSSYSGVILATVTQGADGGTYNAFADFVAGSIPTLAELAAGRCSCSFGISTPFPARPRNVGTITLSPIDLLGVLPPLATLTPFGPGLDPPAFQETSDLGPAWYLIPGVTARGCCIRL